MDTDLIDMDLDGWWFEEARREPRDRIEGCC